MAPEEEKPGKVEAVAAAVAGPAFALSLVLLRNATILPAGLFDAGAAVLAAWGLAPLLHRRAGAFPATLLRGAGIVAGLVVLAFTLAAPYDRAVPPLVLLALGASLLQARARARVGGLPVLLAGAAFCLAAWIVGFRSAGLFPEPERLRLALLVMAPVALAGAGLRLLALRKGHEILAPTPVGVLLAALLAGAYVGYRGLVAERVENLPLYEWTLGVGVAALLLARLRRHARAGEVPEAWESDARRHAQDVVPLYDARMGPLAAVVARYLEQGAGFDEYRAALARAAPHAPAAYHKALEAARPVPPARGKAARAARAKRLEAHRDLLRHLRPERGPAHGHAPPPMRTDS